MKIPAFEIPEPSALYTGLEVAAHDAGLPATWFFPFGVMVGQLVMAIGHDNAKVLLRELVDLTDGHLAPPWLPWDSTHA